MNDYKAIEYLKGICKFSYLMDGEYCSELSFYDDSEIFGGTIRKSNCKHEAIGIASKMPYLKCLNIRKCKIGNLPNFASRCLTYLDLSCNDLSFVPDWVLDQPLKFLNLGANKIHKLPDLSGMPLETLKVHKNLISSLPKISKNIKSLNLYLNRMTDIPKQVFDLPLLEVFSFGVTDSKNLPSLSSLLNLRWLTLTVNQFQTLPDDICLLKKLEGLQLSKNCLRCLPKLIGDMNLKFLTLYSNEIVELPESFFNLKLSKLNLSYNPIKDRQRIESVYSGIDLLRL